jgi:hypothetical protein
MLYDGELIMTSRWLLSTCTDEGLLEGEEATQVVHHYVTGGGKGIP